MFTAAEVAARLELEGLLPDGPSPRALAQIDDMAEKVMSYLNTDNIPDGLFRTFCRLCGAYIQAADSGAASGGAGEVRSIAEGDVTVTFAVSSETARATADSFISEYASDLNRYRSAYPRKEESPWRFQQT